MKKILVVDDIAEYAMVMEMYFPEGVESFSATAEEEAKEIFQKESDITLAIVDVRLNEKDTLDSSGMVLLSWIRENYPETPVIMISAYQSAEYSVEALERGAYCFLQKPLQPKQVREVLSEILNS